MASTPEVPYEPRGSARQIFDGDCRHDREIILAGAAGTGKTRSVLEKIHLICLKYPGTRALLARKHRTDLVAAALVTWKEYVLHPNDGVAFIGAAGDHPAEYRYPRKNGKMSTVTIGGLDKEASNIMSREFDIIYVQEATELTESDWENLTSRLRGVALPYSQIVGDCNPSYPSHWIKRRAERGILTLLTSLHQDNPLLWNDKLQDWTEKGRRYVIETLGNLTGVRLQRLAKGLWVAAEGLVFEGWDRDVHIIDPFDIPADWPAYLVIDFGFTNPLVAQLWREDHDGRIYRTHEIYYTKRLVEDHAVSILAMLRRAGGDHALQPKAVVCDHDAEDRATLERHLGMPTTAAIKTVSNGIQAVQSRLKVQKDGKPRAYFFRTTDGYGLQELDPALEQAKKPVTTVDEIEAYAWPVDATGKRAEEPVKKDDHGCLVADTLIATPHGSRSISDILPGDLVCTRSGPRVVQWSGITSKNSAVVTAKLTNGGLLRGTGNHPVWTLNRGWARLDSLRYTDILLLWQEPDESRPLSSTVLSFGGTPIARIGRIASTLGRILAIRNGELVPFIRKYGRPITARSLPDMISIIRTSTSSTTGSQISSASGAKITSSFTVRIGLGVFPSMLNEVSRRLGSWLLSGIGLLREGSGIPYMGAMHTQNVRRYSSTATSVALDSERSIVGAAGFARMPARPELGSNPALITSHGSASGAEQRSQSINTRQSQPAPVRVHSVYAETKRQDVYNLTVEGSPEFFASGVLVHNCDSFRYMVMYVDEGAPMSWALEDDKPDWYDDPKYAYLDVPDEELAF